MEEKEMNENEVVSNVTEATKELTPAVKTMNVPVVLGAAGVGLGAGIGLMIVVPLAWKGIKGLFKKKDKPVEQKEAKETEKNDEDQD
jgi:hypothetical protein